MRTLTRYPEIVPFIGDEAAAIGRAKTIRIETTGAGGQVHRTVIWAVVDDGRVFVRSHRGAGARWYRETVAAPAVTVLVGGRRVPVTAMPATDPDSIRRTSAGFRSKYHGDPAAESMCRDEILETTLRLEPREGI